LKEFVTLYQGIYKERKLFDIYRQKESDDNETEIDLFNFIFMINCLKVIFGFQEFRNQDPNEEKDIRQSDYFKSLNNKMTQEPRPRIIQIIVKSALRLVSSNSDKYNPFFVVKWGDNTYHTSETILRSSYPAWNESLKLTIFEKDIHLIKGNVPIQFLLFSKSTSQLFSTKPNSDAQDEFIGETQFPLQDLFKLATSNNNNEHEGYYHILSNSGGIKGQFLIKFKFDSEVIEFLKSHITNQNYLTSGLNFNLTKNFFDDKKSENFSFNTSAVKASNFNFNTDFMNCKLTSEDLWKNLNKNFVILNLKLGRDQQPHKDY
jgi:hypothetical protein